MKCFQLTFDRSQKKVFSEILARITCAWNHSGGYSGMCPHTSLTNNYTNNWQDNEVKTTYIQSQPQLTSQARDCARPTRDSAGARFREICKLKGRLFIEDQSVRTLQLVESRADILPRQTLTNLAIAIFQRLFVAGTVGKNIANKMKYFW